MYQGNRSSNIREKYHGFSTSRSSLCARCACGQRHVRETLEFHHDLHHNAYVTNGNAAIAGTEWDGKSLEEIIVGTYDKSAVAQNGIFNNISQLWNHNQFWEMMTPATAQCHPNWKQL